jgi:cytosine/adenosine deaminase-related metal-dependent hydrolase
MRIFSAQYIFTNAGPPLKRGLIFADEDGTIRSVKDTCGNLEEKESVQFYNGIIVPGFVNCHCHLELSHLKGLIPRGTGLSEFIRLIRSSRESRTEVLVSAASASDNSMECEGVILCADICNNASTFSIKTKSRIKYINLLEVFGIDAERATRRMDEVMQLSQIARSTGMSYSLVPHSLYSISLPLLRLLRSKTGSNRVTSVHFMEASAEALFLAKRVGPIMESYNQSGLGTGNLETVNNHAEGILLEITSSGNLMLVHNTYADRETIQRVKNRKNLFWCLCPNSNQYIENQLPPLTLLLEENCEIVIGTDSLASNTSLNIIEELKTLQGSFPSVRLEDLICWATLNGARALGEEETFGTIQPGKKPGLLLLHDTDLRKMELLPGSWVSRLL